MIFDPPQAISEDAGDTEYSGRKRSATDDKLKRSRERNRMHARKTRERKKSQMAALKERIEVLHQESKRLRQIVDERFTATLLLGLSQSQNADAPKSSAMLCPEIVPTDLDFLVNEPVRSPHKRVRRPGKYTQQERESFRRERNRMHAKRNRDRKKIFFEESEKLVDNMEVEAKILRSYLVSIKVMSTEEAAVHEESDNVFKVTLARLKKEEYDEGVANGDISMAGAEEEEDDEEDDDDIDSQDSRDNEVAESGSNNDSSNGSWQGSSDESNATSGETISNCMSANGFAISSEGSDKHESNDDDSESNSGSKSPIMDDDMHDIGHDDLKVPVEGDSNFVNKMTLDAHNSKHLQRPTFGSK